MSAGKKTKWRKELIGIRKHLEMGKKTERSFVLSRVCIIKYLKPKLMIIFIIYDISWPVWSNYLPHFYLPAEVKQHQTLLVQRGGKESPKSQWLYYKFPGLVSCLQHHTPYFVPCFLQLLWHHSLTSQRKPALCRHLGAKADGIMVFGDK